MFKTRASTILTGFPLRRLTITRQGSRTENKKEVPRLALIFRDGLALLAKLYFQFSLITLLSNTFCLFTALAFNLLQLWS